MNMNETQAARLVIRGDAVCNALRVKAKKNKDHGHEIKIKIEMCLTCLRRHILYTNQKIALVDRTLFLS